MSPAIGVIREVFVIHAMLKGCLLPQELSAAAKKKAKRKAKEKAAKAGGEAAAAAPAAAAAEKGKPKKVSAAVRAMQEAQEARLRAEEAARQAEEERRRQVSCCSHAVTSPLIVVEHGDCSLMLDPHAVVGPLCASPAGLNVIPGRMAYATASMRRHLSELQLACRKRRKSGGLRRRRRPRPSGKLSGRNAAQRSVHRCLAPVCPDKVA